MNWIKELFNEIKLYIQNLKRNESKPDVYYTSGWDWDENKYNYYKHGELKMNKKEKHFLDPPVENVDKKKPAKKAKPKVGKKKANVKKDKPKAKPKAKSKKSK
jgi:hypothetical protein